MLVRAVLVIAMVTSAAACGAAEPVAPSSPASVPAAAAGAWSGDYRGPAPRTDSLLQITDTLDIFITGGSDPADGPAVAATCYAKLHGRSVGSHLVRAEFVPFDGPDWGLTAQDLADNPAEPILLAQRGTQVEVAGMFPYCGLRTSLVGAYRRIGPVTRLPG